jgi:uncharacterized membrane protein
MAIAIPPSRASSGSLLRALQSLPLPNMDRALAWYGVASAIARTLRPRKRFVVRWPSSGSTGRDVIAITAGIAVLAVGAYALRRYYVSRQDDELSGDSTRRMKASLAIRAAPRALYDLVANPERLASVLESVESVTRTDQRTSRWSVKPSSGAAIEFEVEIVDDAPGSLIAWRTTPQSQAGHHGVITFESGDQSHGTIIHVEIDQDAEAGGGALRRFFGESAESQLRKELKRLKQFVETGELATTRGQPAGDRSLIGSSLTRGET